MKLTDTGYEMINHGCSESGETDGIANTEKEIEQMWEGNENVGDM